MKELTLVVLAAGMGSRYGGLKQLDAVGPNQEVLMEYSVFDAVKAGATKIVFVIRESFQEAFTEQILSRLPASIATEFAYQEFDDLPAKQANGVDLARREKPWGTGHAVWAARDKVSGPFMAINADDYYGPEAFAKLATHLLKESDPNPCMVGFRLGKTLSPSGTVSRGVCSVDEENGRLLGIEEQTKLKAQDQQTVIDETSGNTYPMNSLVSMNCWGFPESFMSHLETQFGSFLEEVKSGARDLARGEFYLPAAVDHWRESTGQPVCVAVTEDSWLGVTYPEDKIAVVDGLKARIQEGKYPSNLWL